MGLDVVVNSEDSATDILVEGTTEQLGELPEWDANKLLDNARFSVRAWTRHGAAPLLFPLTHLVASTVAWLRPFGSGFAFAFTNAQVVHLTLVSTDIL